MPEPKTTPAFWDLKTWPAAFCAVLILRSVYGLVAYLASLLETYDVSAYLTRIILPEWLHRALITPWIRRDPGYFFDIAANGYDPELGTTAFHPLYPMLVRGLATVLGGDVGLAMSLLAIVIPTALCVVLARYVAEVHGPELARRTAWAALLLPGTFLWFGFWTDALFVLLALSCLWALHRNQWLSVGVLACLAALTRQQGIVLALPIFWHLWQYRKTSSLPLYAWLTVLSAPLGYLSYSVYRIIFLSDTDWTQAHSLTEYVHLVLVSRQANHIAEGQHFAWPWQPLWGQLKLIYQSPDELERIIDLVFGWALIAALMRHARRFTTAEILYSLGILIASLCYYNGAHGPYMALPRHILIAFPLFIGVAIASQKFSNARIWIIAGLSINLLLVLLTFSLRWIP